MHVQILFTLWLPLLLLGCGGRSKQPITVKEPVKDTREVASAEEFQASLIVTGVTSEDAKEGWLTWELLCASNRYSGTRDADVGDSVAIRFSVAKADMAATCTVSVGGTIPEDLSSYFEAADGILYKSGPLTIDENSQVVALSKIYEGQGAAGKASAASGDEIEVVTKEGQKCSEFDLETFSCIK